jgi:holliday junction resolvase Hjr
LTRGIDAERSLVNTLWKNGFAVMRAPSSGSATKRPLPDIIAGSKKRSLQFVIEVKTTHLETLYVESDSIHQLLEFSQTFGCEAYLAIRFKSSSRNWIFIRPSQLQITRGKNYKITLKEALATGFDLKTLIGEGKQMRLRLEN